MKLYLKVLIRIFLSFLTVIVGTLLLITIIFVVNSKNGEITYLFDTTAFLNTGTSMVPEIEPGDMVMIKKQSSYEKGDVISFISPDNYITTHRIIEIEGNNYVTKGDSNKFIDSKDVNIKDIYGKVILIVPNVGPIINFVSKYGVYLLIAAIVIGTAIPIIKRYYVR